MHTMTFSIALLLAGLLFQTVAFALLNTMVPLWLEQDSTPIWQAGMVGSAFFLGNLAGTLAAGRLIDKTGFKSGYLYAVLLCAVSTVLLPLLPGIWSWGVLRLITGISCALIWVIVESAMLRAGTIHTRGILLGIYMIVYYSGTVAGQLLLTFLPGDIFPTVFGVCILCTLSVVPMIWFKLQAFDSPQEATFTVHWLTLLKHRSVYLGAVGCVISGMVLASVYCLMPLFLKHLDMAQTQIGVWMAILVAAGIAGQYPVSLVASKYGRAFVMKGQTCIVIAACMLLLFHAITPAFILLGFAGFSLYPVALSWGCDQARSHELVSLNQILLLAYSLGTLVGPMLISFCMQRFSYATFPLVIACITFTLFAFLMINGYIHKHHDKALVRHRL